MISLFNRTKFYFLFFITVFVFYGSAIKNDFNLDDRYIFENIPAKESGIKETFSVFAKRFNKVDYRPVAMFTFALEQQIFGEINPVVSHFINIFLLALLSFILFSTLKKIPAKHMESIALIATLLFIAHPVHNGVVCSLKSRDGLFSMLFTILSFRQYVLYQHHKKTSYIFWGLLCYALALSSKLDALSLVFIIPLANSILYRKNWKNSLLLLFLLALAQFIFRDVLINRFIPIDTHFLNRGNLFTENPIYNDSTLITTLGQAVSTYFYYLKFMFIPKGYYFYFGYNEIPLRPIYHPIVLLELIVVIFPLLLAIYLYKKNNVFTFGILYFYACLIYCSNIITPVQGIIADRYVFMASLGIFISTGAILMQLVHTEKCLHYIRKLKPNKISPDAIALLITALLCLGCLPFVHSRNKAWKDILTLFETDLPNLKNSFEANRIASTTYTNRAMNTPLPAERTELFLKALQYAKQANKVYSKSIFVNETIGLSYYGLGKIPEAEKHFKKTITQFDTSTVSWDLLGDITFKRGNYDSAALCYGNVLRVSPDNNSAYYKYPNSLQLAGKKDSAFNFLVQLAKEYPNWYTPYESVSYLYFNQGDTLLGLKYLVISFENGLRNKGTYDATKQLLVDRKQQPLLDRLNKISW